MAAAQWLSPGALRSLYQADFFQGREYVDYLADQSAHQKTLAGHLRLVRRYVPTGGRILEIGCAHGFFLELTRSSYPDSVGVELSAPAVGHARARGLDVREGDLGTVGLEGCFDAVCLWDTLEHLPQPDETLRQACGLLPAGGHVFLSTGDFGALLARLQGRFWRQIHPPTHLFCFTRPSLRALCSRLGLVPVRFATVRVYRRVGSALQALAQGRSGSVLARLAAGAERVMPSRWLQLDIPLNLGDTLVLVARKRG